MRLMMVSGDRQVVIGEKGPFHAMQREFSRYFERIDVLCPRPTRAATVTSIHERVHFHPAPVSRARMVGWIAQRGAELLAEHGASLIVSHDYGWFYNGLGSARLSRASAVPYLSEIHHVPGHPVAADLRERFDKRVARAYVRWARTRAAAFRVVNQHEMPPLLRSWGVPEAQILVLPSLYIDHTVFARKAEAPPPDVDVCYVGRMVNNKGLDRIVAALGLLAQKGAPCRALFVGRGPLLEPTRQQVRSLGLEPHVRFVEWVDTPTELADIYRRSRVVVCASTCEGGPRFTVEAMACGTPVVSTPVGVMSELLASGDAGRLVGFDAESLARGIADLLVSEPVRLEAGRRAHEIAQPFEYARTIRAYAEGLHALAEKASRSH